MNKIKLLKILINTYNRPFSLAVKLKIIGFPLIATTKSNNQRNLTYLGDIVSDFLYERFGINFYHEKSLWTDQIEVFINEGYSFLKGGNSIIDVGANIGDSPLYFFLSGFHTIIAIEPFPQNFAIMLKNISSNNLQNKVIPINGMIGNQIKNTYIQIPKEITTGVQAVPISEDSGLKIPMLTISKLLEDYQLVDPYLKMDCEGCEYDSILIENDEILRKFKKIQIEYHYGPEKLVEKLINAGFKVKYTRPRESFNRCAINPNRTVGYIYAKRK